MKEVREELERLVVIESGFRCERRSSELESGDKRRGRGREEGRERKKKRERRAAK
jgi:hypothetical protein